MMIDFFLPGVYFFTTRLKKIHQRISFFFIYFIPTFILYSFSLPGVNYENAINYILAVCLIYLVYEIGYMENDSISEDIELNPTNRISSEKIKVIEKNKHIIYIARILCGLVISLLLPNFFLAITLIVVILFVYFIYNTTKYIRLRLPLHFILVMCRYYGPIFLCIGFDSDMLLISALIFPLHNTLERLREEKYYFSWSIRSFFLFDTRLGRVFYYLILFFCVVFSSIFIRFDFYPELIFLILYFFSYRALSLFLYRYMTEIR